MPNVSVMGTALLSVSKFCFLLRIKFINFFYFLQMRALKERMKIFSLKTYIKRVRKETSGYRFILVDIIVLNATATREHQI